MGCGSQRSSVIDNRLSELAGVERWLADLMAEWSVSVTAAFALDLVLNEAVTNVITDAYPNDEPDSIAISLTRTDRSLILQIEVHGNPFDPLTVPAIVPAADLTEAPTGGREVHLMKRYADELSYAYVSGSNRLRLVLKDPGPA